MSSSIASGRYIEAALLTELCSIPHCKDEDETADDQGFVSTRVRRFKLKTTIAFLTQARYKYHSKNSYRILFPINRLNH
jgi:hypothetical protein